MSFPDFNYNPVVPDTTSYRQEIERLKREQIERKRAYKDKYPPGSIQADREEVINFMISRHPYLELVPDDMLCEITDRFLEALTELPC